MQKRPPNGRRQTLVGSKDNDTPHSAAPSGSDFVGPPRDVLDAVRALLEQSTCFESLMKSLALVDEGAAEDEEELDPVRELAPGDFQAAQAAFPTGVLRLPSGDDLDPSLTAKLSVIRLQLKAFQNEYRASQQALSLDLSLSRLLQDELEADPVHQLCRTQNVLRTICEDCPIDRESLQKFAEMDFSQTDRCLEKLLKIMTLHKRQHMRRHRDKETLYALIYHGLCFQSQRSPAAGFPMERLVSFAAYYFPTLSVAEVYRACDWQTSGVVDRALFLRAVAQLAKATDGTAELFLDKRCYEAWVLLGGNQDRTGTISADILRLNANVLRIAPQHVEASLAELGGAELTFPVFFGMLAALQNQVIQPRLRPKAVRLKGPTKDAAGAHPADPELLTPLPKPQRQSIYSLRSNESSPPSFVPTSHDETETESASELEGDEEPAMQRRFQAIVKRHDELQRTYRNNTAKAKASPFTLHSRILFRRMRQKGAARRPGADRGDRPQSQLYGEEAELADSVAEFFHKYLLHKATRHSQWDSPYSAANLQQHGYDRFGSPKQLELLASLRAEGVLPETGRTQRSLSTPQRSTAAPDLDTPSSTSRGRSLGDATPSLSPPSGRSQRRSGPPLALSAGLSLPALPKPSPAR
eukprot:EG_transcript_4678